MNKKLLISLSSLLTITVTLPILATVSCAGDAFKNLIIIAKPTPKLTNEDITALKGTNLSAQLTSLQKLFEGTGLISENQKNFKILIDEKNQIVALIANSGFTINGESTLNSNKYEIESIVGSIDLKITAKAPPKLTTAQVGYLSTGNDTEKQGVLGLLFDPITADNYKNFTFAVDKQTITLTAAEGFVFGSQKTLSNTFTVDSPTTQTDLTIIDKGNVELFGNQILNLTSTIAANQLTSLKLLFDGKDLTEDNLKNFKVSVNQKNNIVTLTAEPNFTINKQPKLDSKPYTVKNVELGISVKKSATITAQDILDLKSGNPAKEQVALGWFFHPITEINFPYFTFKLNEVARTVTLETKQGFIFTGNRTTLVSNPYTVA
ncbi:MAG: hypothetical protein ACRC9U_01910 [Metamycoplasmataceae bacterium]